MAKRKSQKASTPQLTVSSAPIPLLQPRAFSTTEQPSIAESLQADQESEPAGATLGHSLERINTRPLSQLPIQPKLTIGQVGDPYEQEADRVAAQVVSQINTPASPAIASPKQQPNTPLRRKALGQPIQRSEAVEAEDEELQMKPADSIQRLEAVETEDEALQMKPVAESIQRSEAVEVEDEELQMKPAIQRRADVGGMAASSNLESSINQARGGGQGMPDSIRQPMEQAFGANFSNVRIHTDSQADQLSRSINAQAFTTKNDIFFSKGKYSSDDRGGQELLAHELTHVVQQGGASVQRQMQQASTEVDEASSAEIQQKDDRVQQSQSTQASRGRLALFPKLSGHPDTQVVEPIQPNASMDTDRSLAQLRRSKAQPDSLEISLCNAQAVRAAQPPAIQMVGENKFSRLQKVSVDEFEYAMGRRNEPQGLPPQEGSISKSRPLSSQQKGSARSDNPQNSGAGSQTTNHSQSGGEHRSENPQKRSKTDTFFSLLSAFCSGLSVAEANDVESLAKDLVGGLEEKLYDGDERDTSSPTKPNFHIDIDVDRINKIIQTVTTVHDDLKSFSAAKEAFERNSQGGGLLKLRGSKLKAMDGKLEAVYRSASHLMYGIAGYINPKVVNSIHVLETTEELVNTLKALLTIADDYLGYKAGEDEQEKAEKDEKNKINKGARRPDYVDALERSRHANDIYKYREIKSQIDKAGLNAYQTALGKHARENEAYLNARGKVTPEMEIQHKKYQAVSNLKSFVDVKLYEYQKLERQLNSGGWEQFRKAYVLYGKKAAELKGAKNFETFLKVLGIAKNIADFLV